jgi:hypothetical protein
MSTRRVAGQNPATAAITVLVLSLFVGAAAPVRAAERSGALRLRTTKAVVFKDGHALIIKQAKGTADASGRVYTLEVPDSAVLGSFWAVGSADQRVLAMRAEYVDDWTRQDAPPEPGAGTTISQLLARAGDGTVTLTTPRGDISGVVVGRTTFEDESYLLIDALRKDSAEPGTGLVTLPVSEILAVHGVESFDSSSADPQFVRAKRLSFDLGRDQADKPVELTLMYFTPGIRWIPTYRLGGALKDSASMALQAEIVNQEEDLDGAALDLVVGVPHFRFKEVVSPLSLEATLRRAVAEAAPQVMGQYAGLGSQVVSNANFTQQPSVGQGPPAVRSGADVRLPSELTATGEQDLFVYSVPSFTLKSGGRATVPLWQSELPLRHLYTLDLNVVRNADSGLLIDGDGTYFGRRNDSPLRLLRTKVWHQLELTNDSEVPWTTGTAMILRGGLPMGQDLLTYTPPGGSTLLPMTVAVNLQGTLEEEEIERRPEALRRNGYTYQLIRKKGTIRLSSYATQARRMRVTAALPGKAGAASDDATVHVEDCHPGEWSKGSDAWRVNNHSDLTWELTLQPGTVVELTYEVEFYVR